MNNQKKVAAVVVTFNRKELLQKCLTELLNQSYRLREIIVVDNASTDGTEEMVKQKFSSLTYHRLKQNTGGSGGFHAGLKFAIDKKYDWLWMMDDDSFPTSDALEKLLMHSDKEKIGVLACAMTEERPLNNNADKPLIEKVGDAMFVGFLLRGDLLNKVGFPHDDYFIYWDDVEYSRRITREGYDVCRVNNSFIIHRDWKNLPKKKVKILGLIPRQIDSYPAWKKYYLYRNRIFTMKEDGNFECKKKSIAWEYFKETIFNILIGDFKSARLVCLAWHDGNNNISGPKVKVG